MKKTLCILFAVLFFLLCLVPSTGMLLWGASPAGANEVLSPKAKLTDSRGTLNSDYFADLADWFNDRFALRQEYITLWAKLNSSLFRTSTSDDVVLGTDGWLYYAPTLADYLGSAPMTERELFCAAETLALLNENAEAQGANFLFVIAPNKNSLYPEHMPFVRTPGASNAERLTALLAERGVPTADLFSAFSAEEDTLYFATDSHWNGKGAALAADTLLANLGKESGFFSGAFTETSHRGDLYEMLCPAGRATEVDYAPSQGFTYQVTSNSDNPDSITLTTESAADGRLLCYRDSFGRNLFPFLAESYGEATFRRSTDFSPAGLAAGDTMILELVERNLRYLNTCAPEYAAPVRENSFPETDAAASTQALPVSADACTQLEGCVKITGDLSGSAPAVPADNAPIYVLCDGIVYEATPQPDGFCLCLPDGTSPSAVGFETAGGDFVCIPICFA